MRPQPFLFLLGLGADSAAFTFGDERGLCPCVVRRRPLVGDPEPVSIERIRLAFVFGTAHRVPPFGSRWMTQTERNARILQAIDDRTREALTSKKTARDMLLSEGIYTRAGKLRVEYGGKPTKKAKVQA